MMRFVWAALMLLLVLGCQAEGRGTGEPTGEPEGMTEGAASPAPTMAPSQTATSTEAPGSEPQETSPATREAAPGTEPDAEPEGHEEAEAAINAYLTAWAQQDYRAMRQASSGAAWLYAEYLFLADRADPLIFGMSPATIDTTEAPGAVAEITDSRITFEGSATMSVAEDPTEVMFADFVVERADDGWMLAGMSRDGRPLSEFVSHRLDEAQPVTVNGVTGRLAAAFHNPIAGVVAAVIEVTNTRDGEIDVYPWNAQFIAAADSRQYGDAGGGGGGTLQPGATLDVVTVFANVDGGEAGGMLRVEATETQDFNSFTLELSIPVFGT
jgi:hypothetical protein